MDAQGLSECGLTVTIPRSPFFQFCGLHVSISYLSPRLMSRAVLIDEKKIQKTSENNKQSEDDCKNYRVTIAL
jgi:hypothetical protein